MRYILTVASLVLLQFTLSVQTYGQVVNFIRFAPIDSFSRYYLGMLWYRNADNSLYYYNGTTALKISTGNATVDSAKYATISRVGIMITDSNANNIPLSQKGAASGVASLDVTGKVPLAQLPPFELSPDSVFRASSLAAMLALPANEGDICVRSDSNLTFILQALPASIYGNWILVLTPPYIYSWNGLTGTTVSATTSNLPEGSSLYYTDARARASMSGYWKLDSLSNILIATPLNGQALTYNSGTGKWSNTTLSSGSVTSVGLSLPSYFTVTNSPVTSTGTLTATLNSQSAHTFLGNSSGSSGVPTFVQPNWTDITGTPTTLSGYGITDGITAALAATTYLRKTSLDTNTGGLAVKSGIFRVINPSGTSKTTIDSNASIGGTLTVSSTMTVNGNTISASSATATFQNANIYFEPSIGQGVYFKTSGASGVSCFAIECKGADSSLRIVRYSGASIVDTVMTISKSTGAITYSSSIKTGAPNGAAQPIKMGGVTAGSVTLDASNYWEVNINGVTKKVLIAQYKDIESTVFVRKRKWINHIEDFENNY